MVSAVDELVTWLRAQLDDDERVARAATAGPWRHDPTKHWRKPGTVWFEEAVFAGPSGADATCVAGTGETDDPQSLALTSASTLAEVKAKRRILDLYEGACAEVRSFVTADQRAAARVAQFQLEAVITAFAQPYAGRDGWREEWRA